MRTINREEFRQAARKKGDKHYFTGIPCRFGHVAKRFVSDGKCVECNRIKASRWCKLNPEKHREQLRKSASKRKDKVYAWHKRWRDKNKERLRLSALERDRRRRAANPEKIREAQQRYRDAHPDTTRAYSSLRRARIAAAGGKHTATDIERLKVRQRGLCYWCAKPFGQKYEVDHIWPISKRGSNDARNIALSCPPCNWSKGAKTPAQFAGRLF